MSSITDGHIRRFVAAVSFAVLSPSFAQAQPPICWEPLESSRSTPARELSFTEWLSLGRDALLDSERLDNLMLVEAYNANSVGSGDWGRTDGPWIAITRSVAEWRAQPVRPGQRNCISDDQEWYLAPLPGNEVSVLDDESYQFVIDEFPQANR